MATPDTSPLHSPRCRRSKSTILWRIEDLCDPQICDSCSCEFEEAVGDTRFLTSMVAHQLPRPDTYDDEDLLLASLVAHMVCKLIGDEERRVCFISCSSPY